VGLVVVSTYIYTYILKKTISNSECKYLVGGMTAPDSTAEEDNGHEKKYGEENEKYDEYGGKNSICEWL